MRERGIAITHLVVALLRRSSGTTQCVGLDRFLIYCVVGPAGYLPHRRKASDGRHKNRSTSQAAIASRFGGFAIFACRAAAERWPRAAYNS